MIKFFPIPAYSVSKYHKIATYFTAAVMTTERERVDIADLFDQAIGQYPDLQQPKPPHDQSEPSEPSGPSEPPGDDDDGGDHWEKVHLNVVVKFDDQVTDADSVTIALNILLESALSTPGILEYEDIPDDVDPGTPAAQGVSVPEPQVGDFELGSEGAGEVNLHLEANYYRIGSNSLDSLIGALDTLMDTALSTLGVLDELGTIEVSGFAPVS